MSYWTARTHCTLDITRRHTLASCVVDKIDVDNGRLGNLHNTYTEYDHEKRNQISLENWRSNVTYDWPVMAVMHMMLKDLYVSRSMTSQYQTIHILMIAYTETYNENPHSLILLYIQYLCIKMKKHTSLGWMALCQLFSLECASWRWIRDGRKRQCCISSWLRSKWISMSHSYLTYK